jgi:hypothetical protein
MVNEPSPSPWQGSSASSTAASTARRSLLPRRWRDARPITDNHIGLRPAQGWRQRNIRYWGDILLPTMFSPRQPSAYATLR